MTIYLIRHAQSAFNAVHDPNKPDPMIFDAPITELGKTQAIQARSEVEKLEIKNVIVSPFTRTLQTALLIFGKNIPFQINAIVREQLCNSCDVGSKPKELSMSFPDFNFDHLSEFAKSRGKTLMVWEGFADSKDSDTKVQIPTDIIVSPFDCFYFPPPDLVARG